MSYREAHREYINDRKIDYQSKSEKTQRINKYKEQHANNPIKKWYQILEKQNTNESTLRYLSYVRYSNTLGIPFHSCKTENEFMDKVNDKISNFNKNPEYDHLIDYMDMDDDLSPDRLRDNMKMQKIIPTLPEWTKKIHPACIEYVVENLTSNMNSLKDYFRILDTYDARYISEYRAF